tara:strand:- start:5980 stop:6429 length:450 start_codon:yes stop_codon:yes gene_type:complete
MNWETFQTALHNAPEDKQAIAGGEAIPTCVKKAVTEGKVDQAQTKAVIQLFATQYLDPNQKDSAVAELKKQGVPDVEELFKSLGFCIASAPTETIGGENPDLEEEIKEAEEALGSVPQFRTMPEDVKSQAPSDTTYTTTQEAILKEGEE